MNYLFRYLQALVDAELSKLDGIELSPREEETLTTLIGLRRTETTREEVMERLAMRSTMFDKTCSVLLRKVYDVMAPGGTFAVLGDLKRRRLVGHFMHEVMRGEKEICPRTSTSLVAFHYGVFELLQVSTSVEFEYAPMHAIARRLRRLGPSPEILFYLDVSLLKLDVWKTILGSSDPVADRRLLRRLQRMQSVAADAEPRSRYVLLRAWSDYYSQISVEVNQRRRVLHELIELCHRYPDELDGARLLACRFNLAEHEYFFGSNFAEAYRMYCDLFREQAMGYGRSTYHTTKLIQLSMILGHYAQAERILTEHFGREPDEMPSADFKGGALNWTKLYLLMGRFADAWRYLEIASAINRGGRHLVQYEIQCRLLRIAWFAMTGERAQVERLAPATLKYLCSKRYGIGSGSLYPWFVKLTLAIGDERAIGKALSAQLEKKYAEYQHGAAAQYGAFLKKMREGTAAAR